MSIKVEIFSSPHCNVCTKTSDILRELAKEIGDDKIQWRKVSVLDELDLAVSLGVLSTPSIVINDVLVFTGLPSKKKLRAELLKRLEQ